MSLLAAITLSVGFYGVLLAISEDGGLYPLAGRRPRSRRTRPVSPIHWPAYVLVAIVLLALAGFSWWQVTIGAGLLWALLRSHYGRWA
jgi:hypothetical protein